MLKIISGGQTGIDIAALFAAEKVGLETGGWMPRGCITTEGPHRDWLNRFGMKEHSGPYKERTWDNVREADLTLRIATDFTSAGERCTLNAITHHKKRHFDVSFIISGEAYVSDIAPYEVAEWIYKYNAKILNVAGNSEKTSPGIQLCGQKFLVAVFELWKEYNAVD